MKHVYFYVLSFIFLCCNFLLQAQEPRENWELNSPISGNKTYIARDSIVLKPGFSYTATSGNTFHAYIDQTLLFPPTGNTYADENGNIVGSSSQGAVVGSIPGAFDVSPTGAATYTVPIEVPPGIQGMQPNISLVYNSQSGNGIAGWGWNIGGLSAITKGVKTIFSDDAVSGIDLSAKSDYYLEGNKLFAKAGFTYGVTNAEYETENKTYVQIKQTASDSSYPSKFTVTDKNGTVIEYGQVVKLKNSIYPFQWLLSKITDSNGNYVRYIYKTNMDGTQTVLDYIEYGSNGNTASPLQVVFSYDKKTYVQKQWISSCYFEDYYLLCDIAIKSNQVQLRNYHFTYDYRDEKHFLTDVTLTGENSEKLPATMIQWGEENKEVAVKNVSSLTNANAQAGKVAFFSDDITGDGISDLIEMRDSGNICTIIKVYKASGNGDCSFEQYGNSNGKSFPVSFGDSRKIIQEAGNYMVVRNNNKKFISMFTSNSDNTFFRLYDVGNTNNNMNTRDIALSYSKLSILYTIADFNNDGNDEIFYIDKTQATFYGKMLYLKKILPDPDFSSKDIFNSSSDTPLNIFAADFDGDGLIDVAVVGKKGIYFYKNNGGTKQSDGIVQTTFTLAKTIAIDISKDAHHIIKPGDFNGDGLMDFISYNGDGNQKFTLLINKGNFNFDNSQLPITLVEETATDANDDKDDFIVTDFNHDGKSDLIVIDVKYNNETYSTTDIRWYALDGTSFTQTKYNNIDNEQYYYKGYATTGDFNGDGKEDVFCYNANLAETDSYTYLKYKIHTAFNAENAETADFSGNMVTKITDGLTNQTEITYQPLSVRKTTETSSDYFYEKGDDYNPLSYPVSSIQTPLYCVSYVNEGNGDFFTKTRYRYSEALVHLQGKGFLGFSSIRTKDMTHSLGETSITTTLDAITYLPNVISATSAYNSNVQQNFDVKKSGKIITSSLYKTIESDYLSGLIKTTEYDYDNFGNLTKRKSTQGELVQTDSIAYIQRGAWCINKPGSMRTITSYRNLNDTVVKTFDYDGNGNLIEEILYPDKPLFKITSGYSNFDTFGHPGTVSIKAKDKDGVEQTRISYVYYKNSGRFVDNKIDILGQKTQYQWDEVRGLLTKETDPSGNETTYDYNNWGKLKGTRYPDGNRSVAVLQWAGKEDPAGAKYYSYTQSSGNAPVVTWYDSSGREIQRDTWGLNNRKVSASTEYYTSGKNTGRLYLVSEPYFENTTTKTWAVTYDAYDSYGRNTYRTTPLGQDTIIYDERTTTVKTPESVKSTTLNSSGFTESNTVNGKQVTYAYYPNGLVKTATPEGGQALSMEYDLQGNRTKLTDPDAGVITSKYDGWGQLVREAQKIHITGDSTVTAYDYLPSGLLNYQLRNGEKTNYGYDNYYRPKWISIAGKHSQGITYDQYDRIIQVNDTVDGTRVFVRQTGYDGLGRVSKETYPSGYSITNQYDKYGYLTGVTDANGANIWQALESNAKGQLTKSSQGGRETIFGFDSRGFPNSIVTSGIANWSYVFDSKGNLVSRTDGIVNYKDSLTYDTMSRLTTWKVYQGSSLMQTNSLVYNSTTGNIQSKSDLNNYAMNYGEDGNPPHALTSISGTPGVIPNTAQTITYTDFRKVKQITEGSNILNISYGTDEQRIKTVLTNPSGTLTRYYMGNYEEEIRNGSTRKIHYIDGGNGLAAIYVQNAGKDTLYYVHTDYQGSLTALSLPNGTVKERYAYDPWGNRRNPSNWTQADARTAFIFNRGYTLHDHLPEFSLINMNGRVYDPLTAQFLSVDPYVQAPSDWLNFNRYAYCLNNPLKYTDPSGELFYFFIIPYINFSSNGGLEFGLTAGVGIGGFSGYVSLGYGKGSGLTATLGASYMGGNAYVGYNSNSGFIAGTGYGFGGMNMGDVGINSNGSNFGINYSSRGGFSANIGGIQYNKSGWSGNASIGMSYSLNSGLYGTSDVDADESEQYDSYDPIPYDRDAAYEFMKANELTDINSEWNNLYADGTLPNGDYKNENGKILDKDGNEILGCTKAKGKQYIFWGKQSSDIYLYQNAFQNPAKLALTIGHELVHVHLNYLGYRDNKRHEATAYKWNEDQASAWNMFSLSDKLYWTSLKVIKDYPPNPYSYQRPIRTNIPINPFR